MVDELLEKGKNVTVDYDTSKVEKTKIVPISSITAISFTVTLKDDRITYISGDILRGGISAGRITVDMNSEYYNVSFDKFLRFTSEERKLIQDAAADNIEAFINNING